MRYPIAISPFVLPIFLPFGAIPSASYVDLEGDQFQVRFGFLMNRTFSVADVDFAEPAGWPWYAGLGLRSNLTDTVGAIGRYKGVVHLHFKRPQKVRAIVEVDCTELYLSLEDPDGFLAAISRRRASA